MQIIESPLTVQIQHLFLCHSWDGNELPPAQLHCLELSLAVKGTKKNIKFGETFEIKYLKHIGALNIIANVLTVSPS
jgi:hypothetical protein